MSLFMLVLSLRQKDKMHFSLQGPFEARTGHNMLPGIVNTTMGIKTAALKTANKEVKECLGCKWES